MTSSAAHPLPAPSPQRVLLAGRTGLIGKALLVQLRADPAVAEVHTLVRGAPADAATRGGPGAAWHERQVDFTTLDVADPAPFGTLTHAYCALGTTIKVAGSEAAFKAVDHDAVLAFARFAQRCGAQRIGIVSALGADSASRIFYNRVKGDMEHAVAALGLPCTVFARPSMLVGDRVALGQPERLGERIALAVSRPLAWLIPAGVRPITDAAVARALRLALDQGRPGVRRVESGELQTLGHDAID